MSIQQNFPAISPALSLNFARSKTLDPRITFTRTSTATRVNGQGLIEVVPANTPRFDHSYDPVSGAVRSLGLLIEEQRSNLLTGSDYVTNNSLSNVTLTLNAGIAPDGTNTAVSLDGENSNNNVKYMYKGRSTNTTGTYITSVFMKYKNERYVALRMNDNTGVNGVLQRIDILNGVFTNTVETGGTLTNASSSITPYPNGWYRITVSGTFNDSLTQVQGAQVYLTTYGTTTTTNGVYLWGAQLEQGSFPTSYIPTSGSTATRTADNVSMTGENFSSWYNQSEGTVYADTRMVGVQTGRYDRLWAITNSNLNLEGISVFVAGPAGTPSGYVSSITITNGATEQVGGTLVETALTTPKLKSAFAFKQNDCASSYNGQQRFVDSIVDLSTFTTPPDRLLIGQPQRFQGHSCMTISQLTYYPVRLPNQILQNLTK